MASIFTVTFEEKMIRWEWDDPKSSVNLLSLAALEEMECLLSSLKEKREDGTTLVLMSGKSSGFMAGADIKSLRKLKTKGEVSLLLKRFQKVFKSLRALPLKKIAVLHGPVMGGGLELALCFDYRIAAENTVLALPETRLGLIPGLGACVYLPRLIGLREALGMILKGRSVSAKQVLSFGLVDEVLPEVILRRRAKALALTAADNHISPRSFRTGGIFRPPLPSNSSLSRSFRTGSVFQTVKLYILSPFIFYFTKKRLLKITKGLYPAPLKALEVVRKAFWSPSLEKTLPLTRDSFSELACSRQSRELVRLFLLAGKAEKKSGAASKAKAHTPAGAGEAEKSAAFPFLKRIKSVAVLGGGRMGGDLAFVFSDQGLSCRLVDVNSKALSSALAKAENLWAKQQDRGKAGPYGIKVKRSRLSFALDTKGLGREDILIEALPENFQLKQQVIKDLASFGGLNEGMIFASNTSSLSVSELSKCYPWPHRFVGLHFFNPAYKMPLVEVIKTKKLEDAVLEQAKSFVQSLGKIPLIVKDSPGFLVNRVLGPYLCEALWLLKEGNSPSHVDKSFSHRFGFPLGPFRLMDEIGLDIVFQALLHLKSARVSLDVPKEAEKLPLQLGLGRKQGQGFYVHQKRSGFFRPPEALPLNGTLKKLFPKLGKNPASPEECIERGVFLLINEGFKALSEGIVESEEAIDLGLVMGAGFPAFFGGPMAYGRFKGLSFVRQRLEFWQSRRGNRFRVAEHLY